MQIENGFEISYVPLKKNGNGVRHADKAEGESILKEFRQRSFEIEDAGVVREKYKQFAKTYQDMYQLSLSGAGKKCLFRVINKLTGYRFAKWFVNHWYREKDLLAIQNYIECEAHRELFIFGLQNDFDN